MDCNVIAASKEYTVVSEYIPEVQNATAYQSEDALEKEYIKKLVSGGYEYLSIKEEKDLIDNLRKQIEALNIKNEKGLNGKPFSDSEWNDFFKNTIANEKDGIVEKTKTIQEDYIKVLERDDGSKVNIKLIDKDKIYNNKLQVINQYVVDDTERKNRYDVTILVNGLPLVHTELKRRGVSLKEAFNQINRYQRESFWASSGLFEYVQIFIISNGTYTRYYSNTTRDTSIKTRKGEISKKTSNSYEFTSCWADQKNRPINDLVDFTKTFLSKNTILNVLTKYCIFTSEQMLMVLRPYQIIAVEKLVNKVENSTNEKKFACPAAGGYFFHTTGSGKTLTSFVAARQISQCDYIDKVIFVVDRKDLDAQTIGEYEKFQKGAVNSNDTTKELQRQLENHDEKGGFRKCDIIVTTIQKLGVFIKWNKNHPVYNQHVVIIFDECHRSQFGELHKNISKTFKKYHMFGFTGTPIYAKNGIRNKGITLTTEQVFGEKLHSYTVVDAIRDGNVIPFSIDFVNSFKTKENAIDKKVVSIDTANQMESDLRVRQIVSYMLDNYDQKTKRHEVYTSKGKIMHGFNSLFACSSIKMANKYYNEIIKQVEERGLDLKIATIYSYAQNDEEEAFDTTGLEASSRDALDAAIKNYNKYFGTNYNTSSNDKDGFYNYYIDLTNRIRNNEVDITVVVNMLLTGFDSPVTDVLWVDKNLELHTLMQAFSRTNRILNSIKSYGKIVCFRNLKENVNEALALYGDKDAGGIVILRSYDDYLNGFEDEGKYVKGYKELVEEITNRFPLPIEKIDKADDMVAFVKLFGAILRVRNILTSFDEFDEADSVIFPLRAIQNYQSTYLSIREILSKPGPSDEKEDISDDIEFEIELAEQVTYNIDYILALIEKYRGDNCEDEDLLVQIALAVSSSSILRSKKELIEEFYKTENLDPSNIGEKWTKFIKKSAQKELDKIITEEDLNVEKTKEYINDCFYNGSIKQNGSGLDSLLPPISLFGKAGENRISKKARVLNRFESFFEKYNNLIVDFQM